MTRNNQDIGPSRESGYAIVFLGLMFTYAILAYNEFSNGEVKFGIAMAVLMFWMAGTGAFCLRSLFARRRAEQEMKKEKEKK